MCIQVQIKFDFGINYPSGKTSKEDMDLCVCGWAGLSAAAGGMGARVGVWWNTWCKCCTALLPSHVSSFQLLHPVLWQPQGQYHKTILTQNSY